MALLVQQKILKRVGEEEDGKDSHRVRQCSFDNHRAAAGRAVLSSARNAAASPPAAAHNGERCCAHTPTCSEKSLDENLLRALCDAACLLAWRIASQSSAAVSLRVRQRARGGIECQFGCAIAVSRETTMTTT